MKAIVCFVISLIFSFALLQSLEALTFDFEKAEQANEWESLAGTWKIRDGEYREVADADGPLVAVTGKSDWADYTITVRAKGLVPDADWGIAFRVKDINNHYSWQYVNANLAFVSYVNGSRSEDFKTPQAEVINEWQDFKVVAKGDTFDLYWNGKKITTFQHKALKTGKIGFFAWADAGQPVKAAGGGVAFDDFNAEGRGIPTTAAVEPSGKLSTTWATIKAQY